MDYVAADQLIKTILKNVFREETYVEEFSYEKTHTNQLLFSLLFFTFPLSFTNQRVKAFLEFLDKDVLKSQQLVSTQQNLYIL